MAVKLTTKNARKGLKVTRADKLPTAIGEITTIYTETNSCEIGFSQYISHHQADTIGEFPSVYIYASLLPPIDESTIIRSGDKLIIRSFDGPDAIKILKPYCNIGDKVEAKENYNGFISLKDFSRTFRKSCFAIDPDSAPQNKKEEITAGCYVEVINNEGVSQLISKERIYKIQAVNKGAGSCYVNGVAEEFMLFRFKKVSDPHETTVVGSTIEVVHSKGTGMLEMGAQYTVIAISAEQYTINVDKNGKIPYDKWRFKVVTLAKLPDEITVGSIVKLKPEFDYGTALDKTTKYIVERVDTLYKSCMLKGVVGWYSYDRFDIVGFESPSKNMSSINQSIKTSNDGTDTKSTSDSSSAVKVQSVKATIVRSTPGAGCAVRVRSRTDICTGQY